MTTIKELREIVERTKSMPNKAMKGEYLGNQTREALNFLSKNIRMDGIGRNIASEIPKADDRKTEDTLERIVEAFDIASGYSGKLDKARIMRGVTLSPQDRAFVLTALYGSLKLGITVPTPNPLFGDTFKPQLCGTGVDFDPTEYIIEEKFDGIRCIGMNVDGKIRLHTRNGKPLDVEAISSELGDAIPKGYVVDGEICAPDGNFQSLSRHSDEIQYKVFDVVFFDHAPITGIKLQGRRSILEEILHETERISTSPLLRFGSIRKIDQWIERNGVEGVVAKDPDSYYTYGGRKDWIKVKKWEDISGWVQGYTAGTGKREGILGAVEFLPDGFENTTLVGSGFNDEDLLRMKSYLKDAKKVRITVKYQNLTNDNRLRFPTFLRVDEVI